MSKRAEAVRDQMRETIMKPALGMADELVRECKGDKERARLFVRLVIDAHEYTLAKLHLRLLDIV
jgi:hypothetical protein